MKPILTVVALSAGFVFATAPAIANEPKAPKTISVDADDSESQTTLSQADKNSLAKAARERARLSAPLKEMPKTLERRFK